LAREDAQLALAAYRGDDLSEAADVFVFKKVD
jgi:hypothetical protein